VLFEERQHTVIEQIGRRDGRLAVVEFGKAYLDAASSSVLTPLSTRFPTHRTTSFARVRFTMSNKPPDSLIRYMPGHLASGTMPAGSLSGRDLRASVCETPF
jgi:hypothetical protein